jgi:hypothetical protein
MMYYDQLNAVATHLDHINTSNIDKRINKHEGKNHHNHPIQQAINLIKSREQNFISKLTGILPKSKVRGSKLT